MNFFYLVLGGLVTYRLSLLISKEDGPAYIFRRLRKLPPNTSVREGLSCEWCMSVWASAFVATYYWWIEIIPGVEWPLHWLAMSAPESFAINSGRRRAGKLSAQTQPGPKSPHSPSYRKAEI